MSPRLRFGGWTAAVAALCAVFVFIVLPRFQLETDILALLPDDRADPAEARALDRFSGLIGRNAVWLVGDPDFETARAAAERFAAPLSASAAFKIVRLKVDTDWPEMALAGYLPYRDGLLSDSARQQLQNGAEDALLAHAQEALYTPAAFLRRSPPGTDPLSLFGDFLTQATPSTGEASLRDGLLTVLTPAADGKPAMTYVVVSAELADNPFSTDEQALAAPALAAAYAAAGSAVVYGSGLIQHSVAASGLAKHEIELFGGLQVVGLVLILWWLFRSWRMIGLSAATLGVAVIAALTASHFIVHRLHVMTLVFCSNLAGIAIDYSIYYAADQFRVPGRWRGADALRQIGPAITMSCLAAVLSYALLGVAPFPGLRQIALFCCIGLIAAYCAVMGWFPSGMRPAPAAAAARVHDRFGALQAFRERLPTRFLQVLAAIVAVLTLFGLTRLRYADDIRVLQPETPELFEQEKQVRALIGSVGEGRFILLRGANAEAVLQTEEALRAELDPLVTQGALLGYSAVSKALPSEARQAENHKLLAERVYREGGLAPRFLRELGFDDGHVAKRLETFAGWRPLTPDTWLAAPGSEPFRHLWLGDIGDGSWASVITLATLRDADAVAAAAARVPGARFIDRVHEVSVVLQHYRERALLLVAIAAVASGLLLAFAYGLSRGFRLMIAPVASCLVTLAIFGYAGVAVTFFHVVALHLVTGLSMEYAILLMLPQWRGPATMFSATLAALLALFAFGLLAFSATPFIHSLGVTVAIGVLLGYLFAFGGGLLHDRRDRATRAA